MTHKLQSLSGLYIGEGVNHEGQPFKASFKVLSQPEVAGLSFSFEARGLDGSPYHIESSLLGKNMNGETALWVLSSNHPGVLERVMRSEQTTPKGSKYIFRFGNIEDANSFREEIHIESGDDSLSYTYFWGLPGGEFAERSGCRMKKVTTSL